MRLSIQRHTLACGMPLLLAENHSAAVATADVWVHTGASDEAAEVSGVSHFLEHMLFKGTERWGVGEIERAIEAVGGVCNAGTSFDFTHYYVTLPSASIALGVEMLAAMVRDSTLDAGELEKERKVILEEYRRKQDNPAAVLYEKLYKAAYVEGRYSRTVLGEEETIRAIDRERMMEYYRGRYTPQNMVLVVSGDIDPAAIIATAERAMEGFARTLAPSQAGTTRYGASSRQHVAKRTGGEIYAAFAFPAPGWDRPEQVLALDLAQSLLGQGRGARLYQKLKEEAGLCSSIGVSYPTHENDSLFVVTATCKPEQLDPLRDGVVRELADFATSVPDAESEKRARRLLASAHRFSLETSGGIASQVGFAATAGAGLDRFQSYLDDLAATPTGKIPAAASRCFPPDEVRERMIELTVGPDGSQ